MFRLSNRKKSLLVLFISLNLLYFYTTYLLSQYDYQFKLKEIEKRLATNFAEVIRIDNLNQSDTFTTVVTIFFELKISKHSIYDYQYWMKHMLMSVTSPLVVFTDQKSKFYLMQLRKNLTTIFYIYDNIWQLVRELEKSGINQNTFMFITICTNKIIWIKKSQFTLLICTRFGI